MQLENDNLSFEVEDGEIIAKPNYVEFLQSQGYRINGFSDTHVIPSDSDKDKCYLVGKVDTHRYPWGDERLDVVEDTVTIPICTCWAFRSKSADVSAGERPTDCGDCHHIKSAYKERRAANDDSQATL